MILSNLPETGKVIERGQSADIHEDCVVDFEDLLVLIKEWMKCTKPYASFLRLGVYNEMSIVQKYLARNAHSFNDFTCLGRVSGDIYASRYGWGPKLYAADAKG
jgi:hypothetical protein